MKKYLNSEVFESSLWSEKYLQVSEIMQKA